MVATSIMLRVVVVLAVCLASFWIPSATGSTPYSLSFDGTFLLRFASGEGFTDELEFGGTGGGTPLGEADVEGYSRARSGPNGCSSIEYDAVTVTSSAGDQLFLVNEGTDCVDVLSEPGRILIHGSGTTIVVGGTGPFEEAAGSGTWSVEAEVTGFGPGYVTGTFGPLIFTGVLD